MTNKEYEKRASETDYEYGLRLIQIKVEQKPEDLEWSDIVNLLGLDIHKDTLRKAASTTPYSGYSVLKYFQNKIDPLEVRKRSVLDRDDVTALNRKIRETARTGRLIDIFKEIIADEVKPQFEFSPALDKESQNELIIMLSDVHYGIVCNSMYNVYNTDIAKKRMNEYLQKILLIASTHNADACHLFLGGDLISGNIHPTIVAENAINVIQQIKEFSDLLSRFVYELSHLFFSVDIHWVPGNHSRVAQKANHNQHGDYLDSLIPFYLKYSMQNQQNVVVHDNLYDDEISVFEAKGHTYVGVHGHHDSPATVSGNMNRMLNIRPDVILMGHLHENAMQPNDGVPVVNCGCLSGMDNFAIKKRLVGKPEQMVIVVTEKEPIQCMYPIHFSV